MASFFKDNEFCDQLRECGAPSKVFKYGTAGFRDSHTLLSPVFLRVGMLACARSEDVGGKAIGIMITASHNAEDDNGVKIVDHTGGMLAEAWEVIAERVVNISSAEEFGVELGKVYEEKGLKRSGGVVLLARDTRPHSEALMKLAMRGISLGGGQAHDLGIATTPQLHYAVYRFNQPESLTPDALIDDYYATLCRGVNRLLGTGEGTRQQVTVDCANGVGSVSLVQFQKKLSHCMDIDPRNEAYSGPVNEKCGAEHCQKLQIPPAAMNRSARNPDPVDGYDLKCSLDGDADRIVFHQTDADGVWHLFDGDKIACLVAYFMYTELSAAGLVSNSESTFKFGVVQTAYANGASTAYLQSQNIPVRFAKTGVKFCHKVAHDSFDCGIYFEANGHGTVLFSPALAERINNYKSGDDARKNLAYLRLQASLEVVNQVTGDAISDMFLCLAILQVYHMSTVSWRDLYHDLPSKQIKCKVSDKSLIKCNDNEMEVVQPIELQECLNVSMRKVEAGRCFIRPSGTEDVVRIYAECKSSEDIAILVDDATAAIQKLIG